MSTTTEPSAQGVAEQARPKMTRDVKRLVGGIVPANAATFAIIGAVTGILLPLQVQGIDPANKVANLAVVTSIGALVAMIAQPVAGTLSDRTRSRYGRRAPYIVGGALVGGLALVGMGSASSLVQITIAWVAVQVAYNFVLGPLSAILPDRIPRAVRGTFSAMAGLGVMLGAFAGQVLGASLAGSIGTGYVILAGVAFVTLTLFVVLNPDTPSTDLERPRFSVADFLRMFWVDPKAHPDFAWAFASRLLLYTGYFVATGYQLYILQDYIGLGDGAAAMIPVFGGISIVGLLISTVVSGPLSDRVGRRKVFVFASSALVGVAMLVPLVMPTVTGWVIFSILSALGFGMFQAVDTALISEVLPSGATYAKDLGVVNIAATLPQTLAPGVAGLIIVVFGGYAALFPVALTLSVLGAVAVWPIKAVR
ncbi:MFS transporter [Demequina rhizosphaerae]|uniref:MFS transporter n=1 Tax=Demequina rhizosphaerae TaxID=1638985 RepID=UPI000ACBEB94|nr:MFS transporter [Demequina rhizosphaerae]